MFKLLFIFLFNMPSDSVDLTPRLQGLVYRQTTIGACVSNAAAICYQGEIYPKKDFIAAPQFWHNMIVVKNGNYNFDYVGNLIEKYGVCEYKYFPYNKSENVLPPRKAFRKAKRNRGYTFSFIQPNRTTIMLALQNQHIVAISYKAHMVNIVGYHSEKGFAILDPNTPLVYKYWSFAEFEQNKVYSAAIIISKKQLKEQYEIEYARPRIDFNKKK